ncbi:DNA (cytosine-5-)-methyltransferase [Bacillus paranthracis]|uniref:DNA (cytosine-5-)-methyltransferase n=1 Tax=Bacillus paranthracis TaxID=2026186 RepID=UPI0021587D21|nr:DNA (cytosine-5-)-methyltransferase [Bacillus paranthracis]MCR6790481.1 DNA (cytosine-5-)-methyltransferase [Bacillus paranthracis]MED1164910.1 DNA (cytosine-5-)-methyltransferase [Bacillus paranthracis]
MIPNHVSLSLSELDRTIIEHVPPGGNWKNIPESVPSKRLEQIRESYAAGKGSRSTYYGRLDPNKPSYTMNTYFNRPGNGCHIHYKQNRTLSQREAARLQSFPDSFIFRGTKTAITNQIGNAVPPLLAFQLAELFPLKGAYIDLFSGAGGLSLGFKWAGWEPLIANDIDKWALETYKSNIHSEVILGDLRDESISSHIVSLALDFKEKNPNVPLYIIGGPPCQGFSTAGNRRSIADERNWLFDTYVQILNKVQPTGFIFENVTGLLSMEKGEFFDMVKSELSKCADTLSVHKLNSVDFGVPQRRKRVIIIGASLDQKAACNLRQITSMESVGDLFSEYHPAISVREALSDLPELKPNEDGSDKEYLFIPKNPYQELMRSKITAKDYLNSLAVTTN